MTRLVNLLGVPACVRDDISRPKPDNPTGHWESETLMRFNDRLLAVLGSDWSCPRALGPEWQDDPVLNDLKPEAATLFSSVHPTDDWVWKDPRNSILLPFWTTALDVRPVAILVHRNPLEVATSLGVRDDFGKVYSLALWERYVRASLVAIEGLPSLVTDYSALLSDPIAFSQRVREFLRICDVAVDMSGAEAPILEFVSPSLRHAAFVDDDVLSDAVVSVEQKELLRVMRETEGTSQAFSVPSLPAETPSTEALLAERRYALALELRYSELETFARGLAERLIVVEEQRGSVGV